MTTKPKHEQVTLEIAHTHRRQRHEAGKTIPVRSDQAERLRKAGKVAGGSKQTEVKTDEA